MLADPTRVWTPEDQVRLTMEYADPFGAPGQAFRYSDTGYVLVGDIVERLTHLDLAAAARRELKLDRLGLTATWWEIFEPAPSGAAPRARQYLGDIELTNIHPSIDLYGGGGLVMSARDITTFFSALFEGRIYDRRQTLHEMLRQGRHVGAEQYRLGMFVRRVGGQELYCHGGVWGAMACYSPATKRTAAGVTTSRDGCEALIAIVDAAASRPASGADK